MTRNVVMSGSFPAGVGEAPAAYMCVSTAEFTLAAVDAVVDPAAARRAGLRAS
jgi:hypothetical protein